MLKRTDDLRIKKLRPLISPETLIHEVAITQEVSDLVTKTRKQAASIIHGKDDRILVIVGPCSIHDCKAALEYGERLKTLIDKHRDDLLILMRVYFEKPRTTVGWKGLINDPDLDESFQINKGLNTARKLLLDLARKGTPSGTEFLDTVIPQYIADLISWGAIGARTTESQIHREMTSGLSMPIGFKNGTTGNIQIAVDAIGAAKGRHHFLGVTKRGIPAVVSTSGNDDCHIILRGSHIGPNFDKISIQKTCKLLESNGLDPYVMVDCSHGNSQKDHKKQSLVSSDLCSQIASGSNNIIGVMIESHLKEGKQPLKQPLTYGQSVTDACINFDEMAKILEEFSKAVRKRRKF